MNINFKTTKEADGTYTVTIKFTNVPDEEQATAAGKEPALHHFQRDFDAIRALCEKGVGKYRTDTSR